MGKSGSGKSTLLSLMAGLIKPTSGTIEVDDQDLTKMSEDQLAQFRALNLGFLFQTYHLMDYLTALENVWVPLGISSSVNIGTFKQMEEHALEFLKKVGLEQRAHHFPAQMSGGECARVALARAIVTKPKLILADEPTGHLDFQTGKIVVEQLFDLVKESTLFLATHDLALAEKCDYIIKLEEGTLHGPAEICP